MTDEEVSKFLKEKEDVILFRWARDKNAVATLRSHNIDPEFFVRHFGSRVLHYFQGVIDKKNPVGECPAIIALLMFFKRKKITLQEIYVCCAAFKNSVLKEMIEYCQHFNEQTFDVLADVFDKNFAGVINEYIQHSYCLVQCTHQEQTPIPMFESPLSAPKLQKEPEGVTAIKVVKVHSNEFDSDEVQEFTELEDDIIYGVEKLNESTFEMEVIHTLARKLIKYGSLILTNPSYQALGDSLIRLGQLFEGLEDNDETKAQIQNITLLIDCFVNDLIVWRKALLETGVEDPHYFDQSIISNVEQITAMLSNDAPPADDDDGFEFF